MKGFPVVSCAYAYLALCGFSQLIHAADGKEKPLVVIIPSYNNERWVEGNLRSVFDQQYENYRVIYVADCPTDNTVAEVLRVVAACKQEDRFTLIVNTERCGAMANWYTTIHSCDDEEIIIHLDGDDRLYNEQVLSYINTVYSERDVWLTYGQFVEYPSNIIGYEYSKQFSEAVIANNAFRKVEQLPMSHLRTCKAWLFKAIKLEDVLYQEQFYPMTCDKVMMACMIEMAARHHYRVPDVLYVYNNSNAMCDHRVNMQLQHSLAWHVLSLPPYKQLTEPVYVNRLDEYDRVVAILLCAKQQGEAEVLHSMRSIQGIDRVIVLRSDQTAEELMQCVEALDSRYVLLCSDVVTINEEIEMNDIIHLLKRSQVGLFYLSLGNQAADRGKYKNAHLPLINREHTVCAWYAQNKSGSLVIPAVDMTVWRRDLLLSALHAVKQPSFDQLAYQLNVWLMQQNKLGLFYRKSPCCGL